MSETAIQAAIRQTAEYCQGIVIRMNAGLARSFDCKRVIHLAQKGTPDLLLVGPSGQTVFVETKARRGRLSPEQAEMHARLRDLGHTVIVARSVDDIAPTLGLLL